MKRYIIVKPSAGALHRLTVLVPTPLSSKYALPHPEVFASLTSDAFGRPFAATPPTG